MKKIKNNNIPRKKKHIVRNVVLGFLGLTVIGGTIAISVSPKIQRGIVSTFVKVETKAKDIWDDIKDKWEDKKPVPNSSLTNLRLQLADTQSKLVQAEQNRDEQSVKLNEEIASKNESIQSANNKITELQADLKIYEAKVNSLKSEKANLESNLTNANAEKAKLEEDLRVVNVALDKATIGYNKAQEEISSLQNEKATLEDSLANSTTDRDTLQAQLDKVNNDLENALKEHETDTKTILNLQEQKNSLTTQISALETSKQETQNKLDETKLKLTEAENDVATKNTTISNLNNQVTTLTQEKTTLEIAKATLESQVSELQAEIARLNAQIQELEQRPIVVDNGKLVEVLNKTVTEITAEDLEGVTEIGQYAFYKCTLLVNVELPDTVTKISPYAFNGCTSLEHITMSNSIQVIDSYSFNGCSSLLTIELPQTLTTIGINAFGKCTSLNNIIIPEGIKEISMYTFLECSSLTNVTLPSSLLQIRPQAFAKTGLSTIIIPSNVTCISSRAFTECSNLTNVRVNAVTVPTLEQNVFPTTVTIEIPAQSVEAYKAHTYWGKYTIVGFGDYAVSQEEFRSVLSTQLKNHLVTRNAEYANLDVNFKYIDFDSGYVFFEDTSNEEVKTYCLASNGDLQNTSSVIEVFEKVENETLMSTELDDSSSALNTFLDENYLTNMHIEERKSTSANLYQMKAVRVEGNKYQLRLCLFDADNTVKVFYCEVPRTALSQGATFYDSLLVELDNVLNGGTGEYLTLDNISITGNLFSTKQLPK